MGSTPSRCGRTLIIRSQVKMGDFCLRMWRATCSPHCPSQTDRFCLLKWGAVLIENKPLALRSLGWLLVQLLAHFVCMCASFYCVKNVTMRKLESTTAILVPESRIWISMLLFCFVFLISFRMGLWWLGDGVPLGYFTTAGNWTRATTRTDIYSPTELAWLFKWSNLYSEKLKPYGSYYASD